jgi:hypothetical protein
MITRSRVLQRTITTKPYNSYSTTTEVYIEIIPQGFVNDVHFSVGAVASTLSIVRITEVVRTYKQFLTISVNTGVMAMILNVGVVRYTIYQAMYYLRGHFLL